MYTIFIMVVRMRHTKSQSGSRRSHHALTAPKTAVDAKSGSTHLRHRIDMKTGMYRGRKVIDVVAKTVKKNSKKA